MIIVIADDISGAAEIAAVAMLHGFTAQVQTRFNFDPTLDLIVVDTDSRSVTPTEAEQLLSQLAQELSPYRNAKFFKKVDSVLRGHVRRECTVLMKGLKKNRTLLVPANPSKGRTIEQGLYYIDGRPLQQTDFANDPEYPARSHDIETLLGEPVNQALPANPTPLPNGFTVGTACTLNDVDQWVQRLDETTLPAGAADFFQAWLQQGQGASLSSLDRSSSNCLSPTLIICGSASKTSRQAVAQAGEHGPTVFPMPENLYQPTPAQDESLIARWAADIVGTLTQGGCAVAAITQPVVQDKPFAKRLRNHMAALIEQVLQQGPCQELVIEGGATARTILDRMGWQKLNIKGTYGPGIVKMSIEGMNAPLVTMKPGSYPWPEQWWI